MIALLLLLSIGALDAVSSSSSTSRHSSSSSSSTSRHRPRTRKEEDLTPDETSPLISPKKKKDVAPAKEHIEEATEIQQGDKDAEATDTVPKPNDKGATHAIPKQPKGQPKPNDKEATHAVPKPRDEDEEQVATNIRDALLWDMYELFTKPPKDWYTACNDTEKRVLLRNERFEQARALFPQHVLPHIAGPQGPDGNDMHRTEEVHMANLTDLTTSFVTQVEIKLPAHVTRLQSSQKKGMDSFDALLSSMCQLLDEVQHPDLKDPTGLWNQLNTQKLNVQKENLKLRDAMTEDTVKAASSAKKIEELMERLKAAEDEKTELTKKVAYGKRLMNTLVAKISKPKPTSQSEEIRGER